MTAKIYQPSPSAMQSGPRPLGSRAKEWVMEFEEEGKFIEPLMGWTGSENMVQELTLYFNTVEEAVAYAKKNHIAYEVAKPQERVIVPKSYASNFQ